MEKKIDQFSDFEGFSIKNLQQSIGFWRFMVSKNYFAKSLAQNNHLTEKKKDYEDLINVDLPNVYYLKDQTCKSFNEITSNLIDSDSFLPKLFLADNSEIATKIKKFLLTTGCHKKGVLPSINLLSNFETYQANRPVDKDSELIISDSKRVIDLVEKIPFLDDSFSNKPASSFELASEWLKVIDRWEWLEESWKILGCPYAKDKYDDFELGSLEFLFLLKNALQDKSNPAAWHSRQFNLAFSEQCKKTQFTETYSGVVMVLTELPDPLVFAKAIILARKKITSWKIFLVNHPIARNTRNDSKNYNIFKIWEKNFPLIWPEAFEPQNNSDLLKDNNDFENRRQKTVENCKLILRGCKNTLEALPLRFTEVKSLESMTEILVVEIKSLLYKKIPKIGIVALDRRATRRLVAKLAQFKIYIDDSAGWSLNTSVVSLSIINLIKLISRKITVDEFYYWLKIPLVSRALISNSFFSSESYKEFTLKVKNSSEIDDVYKILPTNFNEVLTCNNSEPLEKKLILTLKKIGIEYELLLDSAGQVALKVCRRLEVNLIGKPVSFDHFINLIEWEFSNNNFALRSPDSAIKIISFQQALWNPPDAILVIGATSQYMPNVLIPKFAESIIWERAAAHLGKNNIELFRLKIFIGILKLKIPIQFFGQLHSNKGSVSWSRWIERIRLMVPDELEEKIFSKFAITHKKNNAHRFTKSHPSIYLNDYPRSVSVSDIKNLIECPYKFFWVNFFGLNKTNLLGDNSEYRETGIGLHLLMEYVGNQTANLPGYFKNEFTEKDWANFFLTKINEMRNHKLISWETALNLRARVSHLSKWCGDFFHASSPLMIEKKINARLPRLPVLVKGKIDRVEQKNDETKTKILIDFKSSKVVGLKNELQSVQILIYSWLLELNNIHISDAGYLCVTDKETKWLRVEQLSIQKKLIKKIVLVLSSLNNGHPVKPVAAKSGHICKSCSVRDICRKNEWMLDKSAW